MKRLIKRTIPLVITLLLIVALIPQFALKANAAAPSTTFSISDLTYTGKL